MTYAQPGGPARPANARIRILGCDPPPPRRNRPVRPLLAACAAVAAVGVGMTLAARQLYPQIQPTTTGDVVVLGSIDVMAHAEPATTTPGHRVRPLVSLVRADYPAAARFAARAQTAPDHTGAVPTAPTSSYRAPADTAAVVTPQHSASQPTATTPDTTAVGPERPPDPTDPNAQIDTP
jgi:hypothetical protein